MSKSIPIITFRCDMCGKYLKYILELKLRQKVHRSKTLLAPSEVEETSDNNNHEQSSNINSAT